MPIFSSGQQDPQQPQQQQQHAAPSKQKFQRPTMDDNFLGHYYNFSDDNGNSDDQSDSYRMLADQSIYANALDLKTPDQFYQSRRPRQQSLRQGQFFPSSQYPLYKQQQQQPPVAAPRSKTHNLASEPIYSNEQQEKFGESSPGESNAQKNRWNPFLFVVSRCCLSMFVAMYCCFLLLFVVICPFSLLRFAWIVVVWKRHSGLAIAFVVSLIDQSMIWTIRTKSRSPSTDEALNPSTLTWSDRLHPSPPPSTTTALPTTSTTFSRRPGTASSSTE